MIKFILFSLFIISEVYAASCNDLKEDLFGIEYQLQTAQLPECENITSTNCRKEDDPSSFKTMQEHQLEYEAAMAKLMIAETLTHLGMSIESDYNALNNVDESYIKKAQSQIESLEQNLDIADFFLKSIEVDSADNTFYKDYDPSSQELDEYMINKCDGVASDYCNNIQTIVANPEVHEQKLDFLNSFLNADSRVDNTLDSKGAKQIRYKEYKEYLTLKVDGKEMSISEFKDPNSDYYSKVLELKKKLAEDSNSNKQEILKLSNQLDQMKVSYEEQNDSNAKKVINEDLLSNITKLNLPYTLLSESTQDNFKKTQQKSSEALKLQNKILNRKIKEDIGPQMQNLGCSNESEYISCVKRCIESSGCRYKNEYGLGKYKDEIDALEDNNTITTTLDNITSSCFTKETAKEMHDCIKPLTAGLDLGNIAKLRKDVEDKRREIDNLYQKKPYIDINRTKSMVIATLRSQKCIDEDNKFTVSTICNQSGNNKISDEAVSLAVDGEQIAISLNNQLVKSAYGEDSAVGTIDKYKSEFLAACKNQEELLRNVQNMCRLYVEREERQLAREQRRVRIRNNSPPLLKLSDEERAIYDPPLLPTLGKAFALTAPSALVTFLTLDDITRTNNRRARQINALSDQYSDYLENYYSQAPYYSPIMYTNTGDSYFQYSGVTNFQSTNQNQIFNTNPLQSFQFTPAPVTVTSQGLGSSSGSSFNFSDSITTPSSSGTSSSVVEFNF